MTKLRPIAIHLPQFHPIPENDEWWGKGFTEWTNVVKAKPLFEGHYQPHIPADLGFYDLRLAEARLQQEQLAKEYGIYGFCYYHYWFNGKRLLQAPVDRKLKNPAEDLPFMLCWANENWTRVWDGNDKLILMKQEYSAEDDREHIRALLPYFRDTRYIRINNKPVIAIYKSALLPDIDQTLRIWREEAQKENLELYICRFENFGKYGEEYMNGFDAAIDFPPFSKSFGQYKAATFRESYKKDLLFRSKLKWKEWTGSRQECKLLYDDYKTAFYKQSDYGQFVDFLEKNYKADERYTLFPGATPSWDNTARKGTNATLFKNSTPAAFRQWLALIRDRYVPGSPEENFLFINAWNEWAEGNHLEPCAKWGRQYLEAVKSVLP